MSRIYLLRHGRTAANERKLYCGSTDLSLSKGGAEALKTLRYQIPEDAKYFVSGMKRTIETLHYLFGDVPFHTDARFREIDFGIFEMKSYEELKNDEAYLRWITGDCENNVPPKGESGAAMKRRVLEAFNELKEVRETVVLISHGGVIAAIMEELFPEEGKNRYEWQPSYGGGYLLEGDTYRKLENENII